MSILVFVEGLMDLEGVSEGTGKCGQLIKELGKEGNWIFKTSLILEK